MDPVQLLETDEISIHMVHKLEPNLCVDQSRSSSPSPRVVGFMAISTFPCRVEDEERTGTRRSFPMILGMKLDRNKSCL